MSQRNIKSCVIFLRNKKNKPTNRLDWELLSASPICLWMGHFAFRVNLRAIIDRWLKYEHIWLFLCVCPAPAHLKAPVFQINTVTSALISGMIILGVMSACFFIFSLTLLKGKSTPVSTLSGVRNPAFNWSPQPNLLQTLLHNPQY